MKTAQQVDGLQSPTYLALHPRLPLLYAGERNFPPMGPQSPGTGAITTFAVDPSNGSLTRKASTQAHGAAHLNIHPSGKYLLVAMNRAHIVAVFPLSDDGTLQDPSAEIVHEGRGPKSPNQDSAFPHSCWFDRSESRVLCCDLALDRVVVYDLDLGTGAMRPAAQPYAQVSSGAGPRHLAQHPGLDVAYVLNELDSTVSVFSSNAGRMAILQTLSALPDDFTGQSAAAQILVHPSGRAVYASNRGHDSIAVFWVDPDRGTLKPAGHVPSGGERPHNFTLSRDGSLLLVANQRSGRVTSFHVDPQSLRPSPTGHALDISAPVCVLLREPDA